MRHSECPGCPDSPSCRELVWTPTDDRICLRRRGAGQFLLLHQLPLRHHVSDRWDPVSRGRFRETRRRVDRLRRALDASVLHRQCPLRIPDCAVPSPDLPAHDAAILSEQGGVGWDFRDAQDCSVFGRYCFAWWRGERLLVTSTRSRHENQLMAITATWRLTRLASG